MQEARAMKQPRAMMIKGSHSHEYSQRAYKAIIFLSLISSVAILLIDVVMIVVLLKVLVRDKAVSLFGVCMSSISSVCV